MIEEKDLIKLEAQHSARQIAKATVVAILIAVVILFTAVLPGEYGIDPLKTGAMLGLMNLSKAAAVEPAAAATPDAPPVQKGAYTPQERIYKVDGQDMLLRPGQGVELKYHMQKGAVMVYAWKGDGKLMFEFHGEPDQKPNNDYYDSYELDDTVGKDHSFGSFTAPSTGIHGWFWQNKGDKDVAFRLTTAGFYDSAKMFAGGDPEDMPVEDVK
jgi:hypothetical protein